MNFEHRVKYTRKLALTRGSRAKLRETGRALLLRFCTYQCCILIMVTLQDPARHVIIL